MKHQNTEEQRLNKEKVENDPAAIVGQKGAVVAVVKVVEVMDIR
jgi:hypothetical protein